MILVSWKEITAYVSKVIGFSIGKTTVRRWHREKLNIPIMKSKASKQGRVVATREAVAIWARCVLAIK